MAHGISIRPTVGPAPQWDPPTSESIPLSALLPSADGKAVSIPRHPNGCPHVPFVSASNDRLPILHPLASPLSPQPPTTASDHSTLTIWLFVRPCPPQTNPSFKKGGSANSGTTSGRQLSSRPKATPPVAPREFMPAPDPAAVRAVPPILPRPSAPNPADVCARVPAASSMSSAHS